MAQPYFQIHFGVADPSGKVDQHKADQVNSNVVSVLQAGAFFGALGSAPMSAAIGRKYTLMTFTIVFLVGAVSSPFLFHHGPTIFRLYQMNH